MKRFLMVLVMIWMSSVSWAYAQPVNIPDTQLKAAIQSALGIATDPTVTDMLGLTRLNASYKGVTDLTGLELGTNLTILRLSGNQISNLSALSGLTHLNNLYLDHNKIIDISPLSGLTNLTVLYTHVNQISDISVLPGLTNLSTLSIADNPVSDISWLSGMTHLTRLFIYDALITDISDLSRLTNLIELRIGYNNIGDISALSGLTKLVTLYLPYIHISDISILSGITNLDDVHLDGNQISDISSLAGLTNLGSLNLLSNPLNGKAYDTYIPQIIANNSSIDISFDPNPHRKLSTSSTGGGSVAVPGEGDSSHDYGVSVAVVASPQANHSFIKWTGTAVTAGKVADAFSESTTVTMDADYTLIANFAAFRVDSQSVLSDDITSTSVVLRGRIVDDLGDSSCKYYFRYFKSTESFTQSMRTEERALETVNGVGEFSQYVEGLEPDCTYRYQAFAKNSKGFDVGLYMEITTKPSSISPQEVLYVDDNALLDPGPNDLTVSDPMEDGSVEHPYDSIQEAIDVASDYAKVLVRSGRYMECLSFWGRPIDVNGLELSLLEKTPYPIIDANDQGVVVTFDQGEDANCLLSGFVLTRGYGSQAGAISCIGSSPTISNCLIVGNRCIDDFISSEPGQAVISCAISDSVFKNCTIADNYGGNSGAGIGVTYCNLVLSNCIVWGNAPEQIRVASGNDPIVLFGCQGSDPLFALPGYWIDPTDLTLTAVEPNVPNAVWLESDYHLMSMFGRYDQSVYGWVFDNATSGCTNLGDPTQSVGQEASPNGGRINAGAYGGTWMASKSL